VDFFFALPSETACEAVRKQLQFDGFETDSKPVENNNEQPFSLRATKSLRLSAPGMRDLSRRFGLLASQQGGHYDGWTTNVVRRA
jgi:hypothetical protein